MPEIKLVLLVYSESSINENGEINIGNVYRELRPRFMPTQFTFSITYGIRGVDPTADHELAFIFKDNKGTVLTEWKSLVATTDEPDVVAAKDNATVMGTLLFANVPIMAEIPHPVYHNDKSSGVRAFSHVDAWNSRSMPLTNAQHSSPFYILRHISAYL